MKITNIYKKYEITPLLQLHQIRAASVGKLIADNWLKPELINKDIILETLILHDMGNIIKFDLDNSKNLLGEDIEIERWKRVQSSFIKKYGDDEHVATHKIGKEIGVNKMVDGLLSQLKSIQKAAEGDNWNLKVCYYSDLRCAPFGIVSIDKRFDDLLQRYKGRNHPIADVERTENNRKSALFIEKQLQEFVNFDLKSINDNAIEQNIGMLENYQLERE